MMPWLCILICPGPLCPHLWQRCKYQFLGLRFQGRCRETKVLSFWSPEFVANSGISMDFCKLRIMCIPCRDANLPGATLQPLQLQRENWGMRISQHPFHHNNTLLKAKGIKTPWRKNDVQIAPHQFRIWHVKSNYSKSFGWGPDV